jgi:sugar O-acyltransferase (sialic acid O-acetyltransferase NeuD family)
VSAKHLLVLGAGGHAREVAAAAAPAWEVVGFFEEEGAPGRLCAGLPILAPAQVEALASQGPLSAVAAIGEPATRARAVARFARFRVPWATVVSPHAVVGPRVTLGEGSMVAAAACLTADVRVGRHVVVNTAAVVSHDSDLEDFATVGPGAVLCGGSRIGEGAYIGAGAVMIENHRVGRGAFVGAGAAVVRDVPDGLRVMGVPARPREPGRAGA